MPKTLTSPPILKEGRCSNQKEDHHQDKTKDVVLLGTTLSYLHVMINILSDRDHVKRYRIALTRLISMIREADHNTVIVQCKTKPKFSGKKRSVCELMH